MPDDFTFNQVNDFFGDVGGMIRQTMRPSRGPIRDRLYFATMARIMSPAFSAWSAMEPMISAKRIK